MSSLFIQYVAWRNILEHNHIVYWKKMCSFVCVFD